MVLSDYLLNLTNGVSHAAVAVATGLVGVMVLAANPRRNWNQLMGFFLLLICGNFAATSLLSGGKFCQSRRRCRPGSQTPGSQVARSEG